MKKGSLVNYLHRVCFILQALDKNKFKTREQLCNDWKEVCAHYDGVEISRKKFQRLIDEISELFGIFIKCKVMDGEYVYYISNPQDYTKSELLAWCYAAFRMGDALLSAKSLSPRIVMETFPSENGRFQPILTAMKASNLMKISYKRYDNSEAVDHVIAPYFIRQYRQRLYVFGCPPSEDLRAFSLDRIENLEILTDKFTMPSRLSAEEYFGFSYGVYIDTKDYPPEFVEIEATTNEACYLLDVPLHRSQQVIERTDEYTRFRYFISPTNDFIGQLLSRGNRLKVISPASLATQIRKRHLEAAALYN